MCIDQNYSYKDLIAAFQKHDVTVQNSLKNMLKHIILYI